MLHYVLIYIYFIYLFNQNIFPQHHHTLKSRPAFLQLPIYFTFKKISLTLNISLQVNFYQYPSRRFVIISI